MRSPQLEREDPMIPSPVINLNTMMLSQTQEKVATALQEQMSHNLPNNTSEFQASLAFLRRIEGFLVKVEQAFTVLHTPYHFLQYIYNALVNALIFMGYIIIYAHWLLLSTFDTIVRRLRALPQKDRLPLLARPKSYRDLLNLITKLPFLGNLVDQFYATFGVGPVLPPSSPIKVLLLPEAGEAPSLVRLRTVSTATKLSSKVITGKPLHKPDTRKLEHTPDLRSFWGQTAWDSSRFGSHTTYDDAELLGRDVIGMYCILYCQGETGSTSLRTNQHLESIRQIAAKGDVILVKISDKAVGGRAQCVDIDDGVLKAGLWKQILRTFAKDV
ncbi:hypothetical protein BGZ60DRAFT_425031 [Tricladium varicosporioides]|nr:hypothetical protein BGZ60DRAFT_425031 [Hymenoscyphus varicosporioides]